MTATFLSLWLPFLTALLAGAFLAWNRWKDRARIPLLPAALLLVLAITCFSHRGQWMTLYPETHPGIRAPQTAYFHFHEIWHYYTGAKYFRELGYKNLYKAYLLADHETVRRVRTPVIRNLDDVLTTLPSAEALARAEAEIKPRFSPERWISFKKDYLWLADRAPDRWLDIGLFDAGFNPPPAWCVIGSPLANLIPIGLWLPFFDVALLLGASLLVYRAFGFGGLLAWLLAYQLSYIASMGWTSGSFLRMMWLAALASGLSLLRLNRPALAGAALAFSAAIRIFPAGFLIGALWGLFYSNKRRSLSPCSPFAGENVPPRNNPSPILRFCLGVSALLAALLLLSLSLFGWEAWSGFFHHILPHAKVHFVKHIGFQKIALFDEWVALQNFHGEDGIARFRAWNLKLREHWQAMLPMMLPVSLAFTAWAGWAATRIRVEEAALLLGFTLMFFFQVPANYYYAFLALLPAVLFSPLPAHAKHGSAMAGEGQGEGRHALPCPHRADALLLLAFFLIWGSHHLFRLLTPDDIREFYYINLTMLGFLILWLATRTYPAFERWAQRKHPA